MVRSKVSSMLIGVDTGGTFTDFVVVTENGLVIHKQPSTPEDPSLAVFAGLAHLEVATGVSLVHGSTVATNALLERRGARAALITTSGFEDVLEIGRQTRPEIYDLNVTRPAPLVPVERRLGVPERIGPDGSVLLPLTREAIEEVVATLRSLNADSVAVCLLHSYANEEHEAAILEALEGQFEGFCTASHEILPEFREFERCSTTAVNAYVGPVMAGYLGRLSDQLATEEVRIMQSNGGTISLDTAIEHAVQTVLSGPAGGVVGGFEIGSRGGFENVITFDMGGTSTDVCLCPGHVSRTAEAAVGDIPIRVPTIDIHTVGAGGGSIAAPDEGGSLRVGPRSAGAQPGPIAYGRGGTEVTVTDANLVLGRLSAKHFLGGTATLELEAARDGVARLAADLGLTDVEAAFGVLRVANATMERAIRVISLERGHDPADFTLVCFGGAGGMHAADLAQNLGIPRVLVPRSAGILSALGMLLADYVRDYSRTLLVPTHELVSETLESALRNLETNAVADFVSEGGDESDLVLERTLDVRYRGQGFEIAVPFGNAFVETFHEAHSRRYGYSDSSRDTEVVNVRVRAVAKRSRGELARADLEGPDASAAVIADQVMLGLEGEESAKLLDREQLRPGNEFAGPGLVVEYSTTNVVPIGFTCRVDESFNLLLEPGAGK